MTENRLINQKTTFQVLVDVGWKEILFRLRAATGDTVKSLVCDALSNTYGIDEKGTPYKIEPIPSK